MIYGSAEFIGIPWDTIIKMFRSSIGDSSFPHVQDYADNFLKYINNKRFCSEERQGIEATNLFRRAFKGAAGIVVQKGEQEAIDLINEEISQLESCQDWPFAKKADSGKLIEKYSKEFYDERNAAFTEKRPAKILEDLIKKYTGLLLTKQRNADSESGIVFAGFGDDEIFPTVISYIIDGAIDNKLRAKRDKLDDISRQGTTASIIPFAQHEMVQRFMEGIDPAYNEYINSAFETMALSYGELIIDSLRPDEDSSEKEKALREIKKTTSAILSNFREAAKSFRKQEYIQPIIDMLDHLPKEDIANMAEALVNLTSIKRRVSLDKETVGGPIDVALISKGDGFVWIKRKHYFKSELNQQFMLNYFHK
jgi:hypothetical protein